MEIHPGYSVGRWVWLRWVPRTAAWKGVWVDGLEGGRRSGPNGATHYPAGAGGLGSGGRGKAMVTFSPIG